MPNQEFKFLHTPDNLKGSTASQSLLGETTFNLCLNLRDENARKVLKILVSSKLDDTYVFVEIKNSATTTTTKAVRGKVKFLDIDFHQEQVNATLGDLVESYPEVDNFIGDLYTLLFANEQ